MGSPYYNYEQYKYVQPQSSDGHFTDWKEAALVQVSEAWAHATREMNNEQDETSSPFQHGWMIEEDRLQRAIERFAANYSNPFPRDSLSATEKSRTRNLFDEDGSRPCVLDTIEPKEEETRISTDKNKKEGHTAPDLENQMQLVDLEEGAIDNALALFHQEGSKEKNINVSFVNPLLSSIMSVETSSATVPRQRKVQGFQNLGTLPSSFFFCFCEEGTRHGGGCDKERAEGRRGSNPRLTHYCTRSL